MPITIRETPQVSRILTAPKPELPAETTVALGIAGTNMAFQVFTTSSFSLRSSCNAYIYLAPKEINIEEVLRERIPAEWKRKIRFPEEGALQFTRRNPEELYRLLEQQGLELNVGTIYNNTPAQIVRNDGILRVGYEKIRDQGHDHVKRFLTAFHLRHG